MGIHKLYVTSHLSNSQLSCYSGVLFFFLFGLVEVIIDLEQNPTLTPQGPVFLQRAGGIRVMATM